MSNDGKTPGSVWDKKDLDIRGLDVTLNVNYRGLIFEYRRPRCLQETYYKCSLSCPALISKLLCVSYITAHLHMHKFWDTQYLWLGHGSSEHGAPME